MAPRKNTPAVDPVEARAAQAQADLAELGLRSGRSGSWKVGCAFRACDRTFDPNGTGPWYHSTCPVASIYYGQLRAAMQAGDTATFEAILAKAKKNAAS